MPSAKPSLKQMAKDAAEKRKKSDAAASKKAVSKKAPQPIHKSPEFIELDSDDDKESEDESSSEDEKPAAKPTVSLPATNGKTVAPESSSESEASSDEKEESSSEEESEDEEMADAEDAAKETTKESAGTAVSSKVVPYKAPNGFEKSDVDGTPEAAKMFSGSNLKGKQIWYFTAPAGVPISAIQSMSLQDAKDGNPVLNHKGRDYAFLQDSTGDKTYTKIMIPNSAEKGYNTASKSIDQVFHIQQIVKLEGVVDDAPVKNHSCARLSKPARPQPKGMKMRFRPLGFGEGELGTIGASSGGETDEDAPTPKPHKHSSDASSLKRKHTESKEKKSKHSSSSGTAKIPENEKLKRSKKNKTESQTEAPERQDRPSASTNIPESSAHSQQPKTGVPLLKSTKSTGVPKSHQPESTQKSSKKDHHIPATTKSPAKNESAKMKTSELTLIKEEARKIKKLKKERRESQNGSS